jgi:hypothetical protein
VTSTKLPRAFSTTSRWLAIKDEKRLPEIEKEQERLRNAKLKGNPEEVSSTSSVRGILDETVPPIQNRATNYGDEPDMLAGVKSDLVSIATLISIPILTFHRKL